MTIFGGQFFSNPSTPGLGKQRIFNSETVRAYFTPPANTDFTRPTIISATGTDLGSGSVAFSLDATGGTTAYISYLPTGGNTFKLLKLGNTGGGHFTGGVTGGVDEFFAQVVDDSGNVAISTFKAIQYSVSPPPPPPLGVHVGVTCGSGAVNGWCVDSATVFVHNSQTFTLKVDGISKPNPVTITTDGVHVVTYQSTSTATHGTALVPVDATPPQITINVPSDGQVFQDPNGGVDGVVAPDYVCDDGAGSGIASCVATNDGSPAGSALRMTPGKHTFKVDATDNVNKTNSKTVTYYALYRFDGFFQPISNTSRNQLKAGSSIALKWRLFKANAVQQTRLSAVTSIQLRRYNCSTNATLQTINYSSGWKYTMGMYVFNFNSNVGWAGTCGTVTVNFDDNSPPAHVTSQAVLFAFTKK
jgi:hypothetical protein